jgi:hypothetical protein
MEGFQKSPEFTEAVDSVMRLAKFEGLPLRRKVLVALWGSDQREMSATEFAERAGENRKRVFELLVSLRREDSLLDVESPWTASVQKFSEQLGADLREPCRPVRPILTLVGDAHG